jgi:hypothetical protein
VVVVVVMVGGKVVAVAATVAATVVAASKSGKQFADLTDFWVPTASPPVSCALQCANFLSKLQQRVPGMAAQKAIHSACVSSTIAWVPSNTEVSAQVMLITNSSQVTAAASSRFAAVKVSSVVSATMLVVVAGAAVAVARTASQELAVKVNPFNTTSCSLSATCSILLVA